ncbi:MAG TPA: tRNA uracil 4-sulfurtransferase ThiI [Desulfuromonadales bacterium]|nr:tRNA uracil 4-sulfurtransferase ThiI [Desulfuromonadales bacterium]
MIDSIIVHYSEIGLKGKNRKYFENTLTRNIRHALGPQAKSIQRQHGRILCRPAESADPQQLRSVLKRIPGIAHFSMGMAAGTDLDAIGERTVELVRDRPFSTFGVKTKRSDKSYPLTSGQVSAEIGAHILKVLDKKVDLTDPDLWVHIELSRNEAIIYPEKIQGPGGLPVGTSGKVLASLSGGLDSPVAASMMMKRGCRVAFVHIRNETQFAGDAVEKIENLVEQLTSIQLRSKLYIVPFGELQRAIIAFVPAKERMIVYRRFMMRILNSIAERENAKAFVTGDSVGQVASQTLDNLLCIQAAARKPVLSPLVGLNKDEIIDIAQQIGTYEHSILPYPDCCSFMIAPHPDTRGDLAEIERYEETMEGTDALLEACVNQAEIRTFKPLDGRKQSG